MTNYQKGLLITFCGVLALIPDTTLLRLADDIHFNTMMAYRGILASITIFLALLLISGKKSLKDYTLLRTPHLLMISFMAITNYSFVVAVNYTSVANTLFILCSSPAFAAIFSFFILKEKINLQTLFTLIAVIIGISLIAFQNINPNSPYTFSPIGDLAALISALSLAASLCVSRFLKGKLIIQVTSLGFLMAGIVAAILAPTLILSSWTHIIAIIIIGTFVSPVGYAFINYGPRFLPAPEVGLLLLIEAAVAPLLVWFIFSEYPGNFALIGGAIVLISITASTLHSLLHNRS
jgi:drug/metabolite transporter (DMT)-like permease